MQFASLLFLVPLFSLSLSLRVLTFNTWLSGSKVHDGLAKIAKHIKIVNPDIVSLQEIESQEIVVNLTELLGPEWSGVCHCKLNTAIVTKHKIVNGSYAQTKFNAIGVKIDLDDGDKVFFWSVRLTHGSYGPYAAFDKRVVNRTQIIAGEYPKRTVGRMQNMLEMMTHKEMLAGIANSAEVPVIVAGDFNSPSDLDWIEKNKNAHGGWRIDWPVTKMLREQLGMTDSYREVYPDPIKNPGITWSTTTVAQRDWDFTIPEPMDRVDFIFYRGPLKPVKSYTYSGSLPIRPIPNHQDNDFPSDHFAVVTEFERTNYSISDKTQVYPTAQLIEEAVRRIRSKVTPTCTDNYVWNKEL